MFGDQELEDVVCEVDDHIDEKGGHGSGAVIPDIRGPSQKTLKPLLHLVRDFSKRNPPEGLEGEEGHKEEAK